MNDMHDIIEMSLKMLCSESEKFEYIEKVYSVSKYGYRYGGYSCGYGYDDDNYYYSGYYKKVSVSFVPEATVYMYLAYLGECRFNKKNELVIDKDGNYYRYYPTYKDLMKLYNTEIAPVEADPVYDPENAFESSVYM
jgi:hypothetical protein